MMSELNSGSTAAAAENESESEVETGSGSVCVNCCQSLNSRNVDNLQVDLVEGNSLKMSESLSSIYKLYYLTAFIGSPSSSSDFDPLSTTTTTTRVAAENVKLCDNCLQVFINLDKFYNDFNQLRSLDSWLAGEIKKLDESIQAHEIMRRVKKEPETEHVQFFTSDNENEYEYEGLQEPDKEEEEEYDEEQSILKPGPWVVIQKLENDPIAQAALSTNKKRKRKQKPNVVVETDQNNFNNDDDEFCPADEMETENYEEEEEAEPLRKISRGRIPKTSRQSSILKTVKNKPKSVKSKKTKTKTKLKGKSNKKKIKKSGGGSKEKEKEEAEGEIIKGEQESRSQRKRLDYLYRKRKLKYPNPCWYCDLYFETQAECFSHTKKEHLQPGHDICPACSNIQTTKSAAFYHERLCASYNPGKLLDAFKCDECNAEFAIPYYLKCHKNSYHHGRGLLTCQLCGFQTPRATTFKTHVSRTHNEEPIEERTCQLCENRTYKNKYSLESHMKKMHSEEGHQKYRAYQKLARERKKIAKESKPAKSFVCTDCNVDCFTNLALVLHRKSFHLSNLAHVCDKCGAGFAGAHNLHYHIKYVHTDVRPFFCDQCGATFKTSGHLREHARNTHSEEGRLKYNAMMREKKLRRKARDMALAQSRAQREQQSTSSSFPLTSESNNTEKFNTNKVVNIANSSTFSSNTNSHSENSSQNPLNLMNLSHIASLMSQSQQFMTNPQLP